MQFGTSYRVDGLSFGGVIFADTLEEANKFRKKRNIGEEFRNGSPQYCDGINRDDKPPSQLFAEKKFTAALHYATLLSYIGLKAGTVTVEETVGDRGVVHEIIHYIQSRKNLGKHPENSCYKRNLIEYRDRVIKLLQEFEKKIPGGPTAQNQSSS